MRFTSAIIGIILIVFSCKNDSVEKFGNICGVSNPTKELAWLKKEISNREQTSTETNKYFFIEQANFEGQTVFIYNNCCPFCDTIIQVFNCEGKEIQVAFAKLTSVEKIYTPLDFKCQS